MIVVVSLCMTIAFGIGVACSVAFRVKRLTSKSCSELIESMHYVDMAEICAIARSDSFQYYESSASVRIIVDRLGGEGLLRLHHNAGAMMDLARYLILMKPEAYELAQQIRRDASRVRRTAKILYWQQRLSLGQLGRSASFKKLARHYINVSINSLTLYSSLVDEVMPLLQQMTNLQVGLHRSIAP